jgi:hypothetical protein
LLLTRRRQSLRRAEGKKIKKLKSRDFFDFAVKKVRGPGPTGSAAGLGDIFIIELFRNLSF